jgi:hypothetical protein
MAGRPPGIPDFVYMIASLLSFTEAVGAASLEPTPSLYSGRIMAEAQDQVCQGVASAPFSEIGDGRGLYGSFAGVVRERSNACDSSLRFAIGFS